MDDNRYLLCSVGPYTIAIATSSVRHIEETDTGDKHVDLRRLLNTPCDEAGVFVAVQIEGIEMFLSVDSATRIETIAPDDFIPIPAIFEEARALFDGAARQAIQGLHPLRLRLQALAPL